MTSSERENSSVALAAVDVLAAWLVCAAALRGSAVCWRCAGAGSAAGRQRPAHTAEPS